MRAGLIAMGLAAFAAAGGAQTAPPLTTNPDWLEKPNGEDIASHYPQIAQALNIEGRAMIRCQVDFQGLLRDCQAVSASPQGLGFDHAAIRVAAKFRMKPKMVDGRIVDGGNVRIPIRFTLPGTEAGSTPQSEDRSPPPSTLELAREVNQLLGGLQKMRDRDEAKLRRIEAGSRTDTDAVVTAEALAALRTARDAAAPRLADAAAQVLAANLAPAELAEWLAYLKSPTASAVNAKAPEMAKALSALSLAYRQNVLARAREAFCLRHECGLQMDLAEMKRLTDEPEPTLASPKWSETPSLREIYLARPVIAGALQISGWAVLRCQVGSVGLLEACAILAEGPQRLGFGAAGLKLSTRYRLDPDLLAQSGAGETVSLPIFFAADTIASPPLPQPKPSPKLNLARQVVRAQNATDTQDEWMSGQRYLSEAPGVDEDIRRDAVEAYLGAVIEGRPRLTEAVAEAYALTLTEDDLRTMLAFLRTPAGRLSTGRDEAFANSLSAAMTPILDDATAEARRDFCEGRDCGAAP